VSALRILHIAPYYEQAWAYGGIPRVVTALARGLVARRHEVTVCTTDACTADRRLERRPVRTLQPSHERDRHGVEVYVFPNLSNALAYHLQLFLPIGFRTFIKRHAGDFDIAHIHACHNVPGAVAARHLTSARVPYVLMPNGTAPRIERRIISKYLFDVSIGRHVNRGAARMLAVTDAERLQLHEMNVPDTRIAVVPNPTDLSEFQAPVERGAFRRRYGLGSGELVMFLGKLTPRKRLDVLARSFARLNRDGARLVIVGNDMGYAAELQQVINELGIRERTLMTGLLAGRDRLEALADANVVCYPSKDEIFGLVPIEAILSGTPVIVADDSGCGEVIRRVGGGLVVAQGDIAALADAISDVLDTNDLWRARVADAAERARTWYASDAVCEQLETVYRQVIAESRAGLN
jgi:glycosyltransferase involved in cell wall biosynthesis